MYFHWYIVHVFSDNVVFLSIKVLTFLYFHRTDVLNTKHKSTQIAPCDFLGPLSIILNKNENVTLQYFIFCEKVLDKKYLLKLNNVSVHPANDSLKLHQFVSFVSELCSFWCFYSLNFASAHAQTKIVMLIRIRHNWIAWNTRKLTYHLKQDQKSISNLSNL